MRLSLVVSASEAVHTFHSQGDLVVFGEGENEVSIHGSPDELRRFADKIILAADRHEAVAAVLAEADRAGVPALVTESGQ